MGSIFDQRKSIDSDENSVVDMAVETRIGEAVSGSIGWVHKFAYISALRTKKLSTSQDQQNTSVSVVVESALGSECQRTIHLADITMDEELVLERDSNDALEELSFILIGTRKREICVHCRWHTA